MWVKQKDYQEIRYERKDAVAKITIPVLIVEMLLPRLP